MVTFRRAMYRTVQTGDGITLVVATCDRSERTEPPHLEDTCPLRAFRLPAVTQLPICELRAGTVKARRPRGMRGRSDAQSLAGAEHSSTIDPVMADASAVVSHAAFTAARETVQIASWMRVRSTHTHLIPNRAL